MRRLCGPMRRSGVVVALLVCMGGTGATCSRPTWALAGWYGGTLPNGVRTGAVYGEYIHQTDQAIMVYVPAGPFLRGTSAAQAQALTAQFGDYYAVETPQRSIYLRAYYIDKFEVTNQQYAQFLAAIAVADRRAPHAKGPRHQNYIPTY